MAPIINVGIEQYQTDVLLPPKRYNELPMTTVWTLYILSGNDGPVYHVLFGMSSTSTNVTVLGKAPPITIK